MVDVVGFADFLEYYIRRAPSTKSSRQIPPQTGFTLRDRQDLEDWSSDDHRVTVCSSDLGSFAMLYQSDQSWASWGVVRQGPSVLLWDCVTLADIGHFPSMIDALAAVPIDDLPAPVANVIQFAAARERMATVI